MPRHCVAAGCDTIDTKGHVAIPKVERGTVYIDFPRQGAAKEMGRGKEVTGMVHY